MAKRVVRRLELNGDVLVVAPHPDDETFGAGMLLARTSDDRLSSGNGRPAAHVAFLTSGNASHRNCCGIDEDELAAAREASAVRAAATLGVPEHHLHFVKLCDGELPLYDDPRFDRACDRLSRVIAETAPSYVFTTGAFEVLPDHLAADQLTRRALLRSRVDAELFQFCVWFWTRIPVRRLLRADWSHAFTIEESVAAQRKEEAIQTYLMDLADCGLPYCGQLPAEFLKSVRSGPELFFRVSREDW